MEGKTFIQVPLDITDAIALKRFLIELVTYIDKSIGLKGTNFVITSDYLDTLQQAAPTLINSVSVDVEIKEVADKVDELITKLKSAKILY
jgi:hypothetical protein